MTAETRLYCINQSATGNTPYWDDGGTQNCVQNLTPLPNLFGLPSMSNYQDFSTDNIFSTPPTSYPTISDPFGMNMLPVFSGNIFNMPIAMPNMAIFDSLIQQIMNNLTSFVQNMPAMQMYNPFAYMNMTPYCDEDTSYFSYDAQALKAKWSKAKRPKGAPPLTDGFYNKVVELSKRVGCDPNDLMGIMYSESKLDPTQVNGIGATGLIQFIKSTARGLGTSTDALKKMSPEEQLVYVEKYIKANKRSAGLSQNQKIGRGTLYAIIFLPSRANQNVLARKGEVFYDGKDGKNGNAGLDLNKDGSITKNELAQKVTDMIREGTGSLA